MTGSCYNPRFDSNLGRCDRKLLPLIIFLAFCSVNCGGGGGGGGGVSVSPSPPAPGTPETFFLAAPAPFVNTTAAIFDFDSDDPSALFEGRLDSGAWLPATPPVLFSALFEGSHQYEVRALNSLGTDPTPATVSWVIDVTAPTTVVDNPPPPFSNQESYTFEFAAGNNVTVEARVDGGPYVAVTSPFEVTALTPGVHSLEIRGTDFAGNVEQPTQIFSWEVDLLPPLTPSIISAAVDPTQSGVVNVTWSASSDAQSGLVQYRIYTAPTATPIVVSANQTATSISFDAPCGTFQLQVSAVDAAGNESATSAAAEVTLTECGPDGTFAAAEHIPLTGTAATVLLHDLNEDGAPDLIVGGIDRISVLLAEAVAGVPTGGFAIPVTPVPGSYPVAADSLIHGDWNRDSIEDLAAVGNGALTILLGNGASGRGNGTFSIDSTISIASFFPTGTLVSADFDDDRIADLAVAGSGGFVVFRGNGSFGVGDGTFQQGSSSSAGSARDLACVDFDADGILDLSVADYFLARVCLYPGNGNDTVASGTFSFQGCIESGPSQFVPPPPAPQLPVPAGGPVALLWQDLDDDDVIDLVVASNTLQGSGYLSVIFGIPSSTGVATGNFSPHQTLLEGAPVLDVATGDFNGDGVVDLVAATSSELALLIGLGIDGVGSGTFDAPIFVPTTAPPSRIHVGDFDRDGASDLVAVVDGGIDLLTGGGGFAKASGSLTGFVTAPTSGNDSHRLCVADLNEDHILDLVFANAELSTTAPPLRHVGVARGNVTDGVADGSFNVEQLEIPSSFIPSHVECCDLNSDGRLDLLLASVTGTILLATGTGTQGVGDGGFAVGPMTLLTQQVDDMALLDIDRDEILDLVILGSNQLTVYPGAGADGRDTGSWGSALFSNPVTATRLAAADLNNDGLLDLVTNDGTTWLGTEVGDLELSAPIVPWLGDRLAIADINGDGIQDVISAGAQVLQGYLGNGSNGGGDGTFQSALSFDPGWSAVAALKLLHLDSDSSLDLAVLTPTRLETFRIALTNPIGFDPLQSLPLVADASDFAVGDFNGDGVVDIVAVNPLCCADSGVSTVSIAFGIGTPPLTANTP